jgi:hypothetical protein
LPIEYAAQISLQTVCVNAEILKGNSCVRAWKVQKADEQVFYIDFGIAPGDGEGRGAFSRLSANRI